VAEVCAVGVNSVKPEPEGMCIVMCASAPVVCAAVLALQGLPVGVLGYCAVHTPPKLSE
jgi:hypothetical protein